MRSHIKRLLIDAYAYGLMPACVVKTAFRLLRLKHQ